MPFDLSKRDLMLAGLAGAALPAMSAVAEAQTYDPRLTAEGQIKMVATLDETPAFWVYSGIVYAVPPDQRPVAILGVAGCEAHWAKRLDDGGYRMGGSLVTFFRDPQTGAFLDAFDNPFTGKRNPVTPNLLSGGAVHYPADGSSARAEGQINGSVTTPKGFTAADPNRPLGRVQWMLFGDTVQVTTDRAWPVAAQPQMEAQTQSGDAKAFFDPTVRRMPAHFSSTTIIPWMTWMDMGAAPGHLLWHCSGEKVFSIDQAPADYRAHAGNLLDRLTTRPML